MLTPHRKQYLHRKTACRPHARMASQPPSTPPLLVKGLIAHAQYEHLQARYTPLMAEPIRLLTESGFPRKNTESWSKRLTTMAKWFDVIGNGNTAELVEKSTTKLVIPAHN